MFDINTTKTIVAIDTAREVRAIKTITAPFNEVTIVNFCAVTTLITKLYFVAVSYVHRIFAVGAIIRIHAVFAPCGIKAQVTIRAVVYLVAIVTVLAVRNIGWTEGILFD